MNEKNIGKIISKLREEKDITQRDLADKLNISDKAISKWETGANLPSLDMIYRISKVFNVSFQKLLKVRLEEDNVDNKVIDEIMAEFNETNKKKTKVIKICLIVTLIISLVLVLAIIFSHNYNKFKVYDVIVESDDIVSVHGVYIETRIKDLISINDIKIRDREVKPTDTISVDMYILDGKEEKIFHNFAKLNNLMLSTNQSYIKIDNFSDYFDRMYIKVTIIDKDNHVDVYRAKLEFILNFSNNRIYKTDYIARDVKPVLSKEEIKNRLLENGFKEFSNDFIKKVIGNVEIIYYFDSNKLNYRTIKDNFIYNYAYYFELNVLEIYVYNKNNTEIENYTYDIDKEEVIECNLGKCNDYQEAMDLLNKDVLNLLYEN